MNAKKVARYQCRKCARVWREAERAEKCCRCHCGKPAWQFQGDICKPHWAVNALRRLRREKAPLIERLARLDARIAEEKAAVLAVKAAEARRAAK